MPLKTTTKGTGLRTNSTLKPDYVENIIPVQKDEKTYFTEKKSVLNVYYENVKYRFKPKINTLGLT